MKPRLSSNTLNLFRDCPRCFWLHINKGIKRPKAPMPSITVGLDLVIRRYFNGYREKDILPPILEGKIQGRLLSPLPKTLYLNESRGLFGRLDECIEMADSTYAPLDHKTRASRPAEVHHAFQFQMAVYTLLLEKNGYKTRGSAYLVYYFPKEGDLHKGFPFDADVFSVRTDPDRAMEVFLLATEILESPIPGPGKNCAYCSWLDVRRKAEVT